MNSSLNIRRALFPLGFKCEYALNFTASAVYLPALTHGCLNKIILPLVSTRGPIEGIKGRDRENLINSDIPAALKPKADELAFASGRVGKRSAKNSPEFRFDMTTQYQDSERLSDMLHTVETCLSGELSNEVPWPRLGTLIPVEIENLRIGLDIYQPRLVSSIFGTVPTVSQTLLLEANQKSLELRINCEGLRSRAERPLQKHSVWQNLCAVLSESINFNLDQDYSSKV